MDSKYLILRHPDNENDGITYLRDNKGDGAWKVWRKILRLRLTDKEISHPNCKYFS